MAVYYKFKSAKDYDSIPIEGQFISVGNLKERIFESKQLGRGTDFDLMISNAQNNEEYVDEAAMIPKNTSVLIRRVPGRPRKPIVAEPFEPKKIEDKTEELPPLSSMFVGDSSIPMKYPEESEWDEFGNDLYAIPEAVPTQSSNNPIVNMSAASMIDEEEKIKALIETPALDWSRQGQDGFGGGRGFGRGMGGRMTGRGFGRGGFERKTPPPGYICHRCKVPGHLIQHCPTNGDPNYDVRKVKPPTGIPRSMLMATPDGSYALPSGAVAVLKPNEAAFEKEIEGMPSTRSVGDIPPELRCLLCKEVMKDAVLTSKCCFRSFCDKCIRDYIINKPMCVCGATNILADDLLPNKTLRETITRLLESTTSSTENVPSQVHIQDMESARQVPPKIPPPVLSAASKDEHKQIPPFEHSSDVKVGNVKEAAASEGKAINGAMHCLEKKTVKNTGQSEATREPMSTKEPISPEGEQVPEEAQEKLFDGEQDLSFHVAKKKKKKKTRVPASTADMQWGGCQDHGAGNFVGMPLGPSAYDPYWGGGIPMGLDGFMPPVGGAMPYIGYMPGPFDVPFGGMMPPDPFAAHGFMMPPLLPRGLSELGFNSMNMNVNKAPPMSREEFEAMKADIRRKRELERHNERDHRRDGSSVGMEVSSRGADRSSMNAKPRMVMSKAHCVSSRYSSPSPPPPPPPRPSSKRRSLERNDAGRDQEKKEEDSKAKSSVFARISFPESEKDAKKTKKKRMTNASSSSDANVAAANGDAKGHCDRHRSHRSHHDGSVTSNGYKRSGSSQEEEEEDDYHFKRRPSRRQHRGIEEEEDGGRYSRASRDHGRRRR